MIARRPSPSAATRSSRSNAGAGGATGQGGRLPRSFEFLDHDSDLGLALAAPTLPELFSVAVEGLTACLTDISAVRAKEGRRVTVEGSGREELLVRWLKEWLGLFNAEGFLAAEVRVLELRAGMVRGEGRGEILDSRRHRIIREVKAVTYHQVEVAEAAGGWRARVIVDV